jgi:hypothetical protein
LNIAFLPDGRENGFVDSIDHHRRDATTPATGGSAFLGVVAVLAMGEIAAEPDAQSMIPKSGNRFSESIMLKRSIQTVIRFGRIGARSGGLDQGLGRRGGRQFSTGERALSKPLRCLAPRGMSTAP